MITLYTEKNVIPEGSTASILIRPNFTITDPIAADLKITGGKNRVRLSTSSFILSGDAPITAIVVSVSDDDKLQTKDIEFTITPKHPFLTFNPPVLTYTMTSGCRSRSLGGIV